MHRMFVAIAVAMLLASPSRGTMPYVGAPVDGRPATDDSAPAHKEPSTVLPAHPFGRRDSDAATQSAATSTGDLATAVWLAGHPFFARTSGGPAFLTGVRTPNLGEAYDTGLKALLKPMIVGQPLQVAAEPRLASLGAHAGSYATFADGSSLNVAVVRQGFGYVDHLGIAYALEAQLRQAEQEAREQQRGLWALHPILGVSIRGYVALLLLGNGDARFVPPYMTAQLLGLQPWIGHSEETGKFISGLTTNKKARLEFDPLVPQDPVLTPVYLRLADGALLNAEIIRAGYGKVEDHGGLLKLQYAQELRVAEAEAKAAGRGMWAGIAP